MRSENVHTQGIKKKLNRVSSERKQEWTYDYLLSLFVVNFNYSVSDFDLLTPVQAFHILEMKSESDKNRFELWRNELRNVSFFTIKASMGDTSHISQPSDLYALDIDKHIEELEKQKYQTLAVDPEFAKWTEGYLRKESGK